MYCLPYQRIKHCIRPGVSSISIWVLIFSRGSPRTTFSSPIHNLHSYIGWALISHVPHPSARGARVGANVPARYWKTRQIQLLASIRLSPRHDGENEGIEVSTSVHKLSPGCFRDTLRRDVLDHLHFWFFGFALIAARLLLSLAGSCQTGACGGKGESCSGNQIALRHGSVPWQP